MKWQEPPKSGKPETPGRGERYAAEARALREHPGQWAVVDTYAYSRVAIARTTANGINIGRFTSFRPAGRFEAKSAVEAADAAGEEHRSGEKVAEWKKGDKIVNVYARYTGPPPGAQPPAARPAEPDAGTAALEEMKLPELRKVARDFGITGIAQLRRAELIEKIAARTDASRPLPAHRNDRAGDLPRHAGDAGGGGGGSRRRQRAAAGAAPCAVGARAAQGGPSCLGERPVHLLRRPAQRQLSAS